MQNFEKLLQKKFLSRQKSITKLAKLTFFNAEKGKNEDIGLNISEL